MSDSVPPIALAPVARSGRRAWRAGFALVAVVAPAGLASVGAAQTAPALLVSAALAVVALALATFPRRTPQAPPSPVAPPVVERAPPFADMLEHIVDPIVLIAGANAADLGDRRFVFANAAARELLRIQRPEGPLTTAVRAPEILAAVEGVLFAGGTRHAVYETRGVQERYWQASVTALTDARPGQGAGTARERLALLTLRDETEVRRSERTRADFLANASHELRTPLASLAGFVETLRGHARDDPEARDRFLGIMQAQAERMRRLIDDLTSLSRIELGEHIPPSGSIDVATAVIDVIDALGPLTAERRIALTPALPASGSAVALGDRDQILQVIQNLAENALKYTPTGQSVRVDVLSDLDAAAAVLPILTGGAHLSLVTPDHAAGKRYVAIRVRDVGPGIARTNLPRLTERFYRVEGQKVLDKPGTGLGLAIVKHIVNRHRGGLTVESVEGAGSVFTAYLPQIPDAVVTAPAP